MIKTVLAFLFFTVPALTQVIISPYIVLVDENNRFGNFVVQNESPETYEITVSFVFGYPKSDTLGTLSMEYIEEPDSAYPSAVNWVRAFPRQFILEPGQRQVVRMSMMPDKNLLPGTYWARIVTSSAPVSVEADSLREGITAKIKFVLNQVTTLLYRINPAETGADVEDFFVIKDSTGINVFTGIERKGNSPFFGDVFVTIFNDKGGKVSEKMETISLYYNLTKKFSFEDIKPGNYTAEIKIIHNETEDIPESKLKLNEPVIRKMNFTVN